jgi:hypothetical protein
MDTPEFARALALLERSGIGEARLLGGEPTLHPEFPQFAAAVLARGFQLLIFSNGLMPEPALRAIEEAPPDRVRVLVNASCGIEGQDRTFERLGSRVTLGFTIDNPAFEVHNLLEAIDRFGLCRSIRLGLAHPGPGRSNSFLLPRFYRPAGRRIAELAEEARAAGIEIGFDCGFVPCMFEGPPPAGAGTCQCGPIPDLLPGGTAVACYPLAAIARESIMDGDTASGVRGRLAQALSGYRRIGVLRECGRCRWLEAGQCGGGCIAASLLRLRGGEDEV